MNKPAKQINPCSVLEHGIAINLPEVLYSIRDNDQTWAANPTRQVADNPNLNPNHSLFSLNILEESTKSWGKGGIYL